uniref:Reverse transcriptase domain-containing protein n=1 Tax=Quercus lobata TaxID=97700 RepID=A0A7N2M7K9_QUELO
MRKMGFSNRWVDLIMACVGSTSYQVLVNGVPRGDIQPTRGIRQEDLLSPYLFLICWEALNQQLQHAARFEVIRGFSLCRNGPRISHLFFTDDTLLVCHASRVDLEVILQLLQLYELASGQKLNSEKTMVFFSKATMEERRVELVEFLGVNEVREYEKYLGLPAVMGRNKKESLNYIRERVWNKLQGGKRGVRELVSSHQYSKFLGMTDLGTVSHFTSYFVSRLQASSCPY